MSHIGHLGGMLGGWVSKHILFNTEFGRKYLIKPSYWIAKKAARKKAMRSKERKKEENIKNMLLVVAMGQYASLFPIWVYGRNVYSFWRISVTRIMLFIATVKLSIINSLLGILFTQFSVCSINCKIYQL